MEYTPPALPLSVTENLAIETFGPDTFYYWAERGFDHTMQHELQK